MRGAGGTNGGVGGFFLGLIMMTGGVYLLLNAIRVTTDFGMRSGLYGFNAFGSNVSVSSGMIMIPFVFGIGMVFYNSRNLFGWALAVGSIVALVFGVIASIRFSFSAMSAFDLIVILILAVGGLGLFLRSFREVKS